MLDPLEGLGNSLLRSTGKCRGGFAKVGADADGAQCECQGAWSTSIGFLGFLGFLGFFGFRVFRV